jgi:chemotaxis response regulator CheB
MAKKKAAPKVRTAARPAPKTTPPLRSRPAKVAVAVEPAESAALEEEPEQPSNGLFPIVGIGASAGGLEAFSELLQALPEDTGMAYVFVQHLDPSMSACSPVCCSATPGCPFWRRPTSLKCSRTTST